MEQSSSTKSTPRDVFMYLLATIALYFSVFGILALLFSYTELLLPDPLERYGDPAHAIRWPLALTVVIFPVYLWASRFIRRDIAAHAEKAEIRVRRWLVHLTLFLAALLIIGDLITLIYSFLEGDLSTQFVLKVLAVLAVAAAVFWYYLQDLRTKAAPLDTRIKSIVSALIAVIAVVIVAGFFMAGSPFRQRLVRFDEQKISDLQSIQWQIISYWQSKEVLPAAIGALRDDIAGYVPPVDPQNDVAYEYRMIGDLSFELCTEFNMPSDGDRYRPRSIEPGAESWEHEAGHACFERTIDPELYPPYENGVKLRVPPPIR